MIISSAFQKKIGSGQLILKKQFIYKNNLEKILDETNVPIEMDMFSIDIDGNDYWVWKYLEGYKPRLIIIEYNGALGPYINWKMDYEKSNFWDGSIGINFGASLNSLAELANDKGYSLVWCNITGVNAFFVRNDLIKPGLFCEPFTSHKHFKKPLYFLEHTLGHKRVNTIFK